MISAATISATRPLASGTPGSGGHAPDRDCSSNQPYQKWEMPRRGPPNAAYRRRRSTLTSDDVDGSSSVALRANRHTSSSTAHSGPCLAELGDEIARHVTDQRHAAVRRHVHEDSPMAARENPSRVPKRSTRYPAREERRRRAASRPASPRDARRECRSRTRHPSPRVQNGADSDWDSDAAVGRPRHISSDNRHPVRSLVRRMDRMREHSGSRDGSRASQRCPWGVSVRMRGG